MRPPIHLSTRGDQERGLAGSLPRTLLAELARSELDSPEERQLADHLLDEEARFGPHGSDLRLVLPRLELDDSDFIDDDECNDTSGDDEGGPG
jgi:hypothetical protein